MFKYLKFAICFLAVAFLVGCGATAPIVKTEHIVVTPTADLMTTCGVSKPPSKVEHFSHRHHHRHHHHDLK